MKSQFCKMTPKHRVFCPKKVQNGEKKKERVKEKEERVGAKTTKVDS